MRTRQRRGHVAGGRQPRGRLGQRRQQRRFRQGQVARGFGEIGLRRRLHAIGAGPEEDPVEIELKDLVPGHHPAQAEGERRLLDLPLDRLVRLQEQGLGQLLGQGRAALHHGSRPGVGDQRPHQSVAVDRSVLVETAVLGGEERLGDIGRKLVQPDTAGIARSPAGDPGAGAVQEGDSGRPVQRPEAVGGGHGGKIAQIGKLDPGRRQHRQQHQRHPRHDAQPRQQAEPPPPTRQVGAEGLQRRVRLGVRKAIGHVWVLVAGRKGFRTRGS